MFTYLDGQPVQIGDSVLIENGRTPGTVVEVVESAEQMKACNVDEPGVMLKSPPFGLVYLGEACLREDPMTFVSRGSAL